MDNNIPELTLEPDLGEGMDLKAPEVKTAAPAAINDDTVSYTHLARACDIS